MVRTIRHRATRALLVGAAALLPWMGTPGAHADEPPALPAATKAPVLDGNTATDEGWRGARVLPVEGTPIPAPPPAAGQVRLTPRMAMTLADGQLFVRVEADEDPSSVVGVTLLVTADPEADSAASAIEVSYRPASLRARTFTVRHPDGVGRGVVPVRGAADVSRPGQWRLELAIAIAPLLENYGREADLRIGAAIHTRTPGIVASSPAGAFLQGPEAWHVLPAPEGGWPIKDVAPIEALEGYDANEDARMAAWSAYQNAMHGAGQLVLPSGEIEDVIGVVRNTLIAPLERIRELRPDLGPGLDWQIADIYRQLGLRDLALEHLAAIQKAAPGWREARFLRHVAMDGFEGTPRDPASPSDFEVWGKALTERAGEVGNDPYRVDGLDAVRAVMAYKEGRFLEATPVFDRLRTRYPAYRLGQKFYEWAKSGPSAKAGEDLLLRKRAGKGFVTMRMKTSRGTLVFALDQSTAPNAVNQIVWLGKRGFYDGTRFHRAVPFFGLQGGDPFTRPKDKGGNPDHVGRGYPGYAVHADTSKRPALRGRIAFVRLDEGAIGSQFFITTGTALHLAGEMDVFGHLTEGLDVLSALVEGDLIEGVTFDGLDPAWTYEPVDFSGSVPDAPRAEVLPK